MNVFFILSGMLLSQSIAQNPNWTRFLAARALRIMPGLFVCGIIVGWIFGPLATSMNLSVSYRRPHDFLPDLERYIL